MSSEAASNLKTSNAQYNTMFPSSVHPADTNLTQSTGYFEYLRPSSFIYLCFCIYMNSDAFPVDDECLTNVLWSLG